MMGLARGEALRRVRVRGESMAPALRAGDVVLAVLGRAPAPGQIGLVGWPARPGQISVKRVVLAYGAGWWVAGDNRAASTDSRELGPADVHGVIRWRLWPRPGRLGRR
jgi:phage repressor protein C with HTH and peptisase S24 domain